MILPKIHICKKIFSRIKTVSISSPDLQQAKVGLITQVDFLCLETRLTQCPNICDVRTLIYHSTYSTNVFSGRYQRCLPHSLWTLQYVATTFMDTIPRRNPLCDTPISLRNINVRRFLILQIVQIAKFAKLNPSEIYYVYGSS